MSESKKTLNEILAGTADIAQRTEVISFLMDASRDMEEALLSRNAPYEVYEQLTAPYYSRLHSIVAELTGADPEQIADPDKRTPEQDRILIETAGRISIARLQAYEASNYLAAIRAINAYCMEQAEQDIYAPLWDEYMPDALQKGELVNAPLAAALYYFATNTGVDPRAQANLTDDNKAEIIAIFKRMDAFYREHRDTLHSEYELVQAFAEKEHPIGTQAIIAEVQTIFKREDTFALMISKVGRGQGKIAEWGGTGGEVDVGGKASVMVTITNKEGGSIDLPQESIEFQNVVGDMIGRNLGNPVVVSEDQLFREYKGLPPNATVNPVDREFVRDHILPMLTAPANINFEDQLKKHKRIKNRKGINGLISSALMPGAFALDRNTGQAKYKFYDYPAFYQYSRLIGQIANVNKTLLCPPKKITASTAHETTDKATLRRYLLECITDYVRNTTERRVEHSLYLHAKKDASTPGVYELFSATTERKQRTIRKSIESILGEWKDSPDSPVCEWEFITGPRNRTDGYKISIDKRIGRLPKNDGLTT